MIPYSLHRSNRKTLAIHITKDGLVEVRAPLRTPAAVIARFIEKKENWIKEHIARRELINRDKRAFILDYGSNVLLCGKSYPIREKAGNRLGFNCGQVYVPNGLTPAGIKSAIIQVYRLTAKRLLKAKSAEFAAAMKVNPASIRINGAKSRWGSCSGKKNINYSWRLIMADMDVIDYVVVHELAHLKELNHSSRFWAAVEEILPDYKARQKKLKLLQEKLASEDWE